jgi:alkylation response protein AidB-like acyl-CoA dehydrogenase
VLVPTDYPGVTVRAIGQINGRSEFSEVFFDSARVPLSNVVGEIGNGWTIAKAVLEFERGAELAFGRSAYIRRAVGEVASDLASLPTRESGALARLARSQAEFIGAEVNSLRLLGDQMSGGDPGHMSAVVKLQQTGAWNAATVEHLKLLGSQSSESRADHFERYFTSRYATIAAGASEIQKDIIARRILNLPR